MGGKLQPRDCTTPDWYEKRLAKLKTSRDKWKARAEHAEAECKRFLKALHEIDDGDMSSGQIGCLVMDVLDPDPP